MPAAWAQDGKAAAVQAYDEAEALIGQGKVSEACPRYAESQKLDPQLGTLLHLADCLERNGQTASAWASFREAAELAEKRGDSRRELALERVAVLTPKLSRLQIKVNAIAGLRVERDAIPVGQPLWGTAIPSDPGSHVITASAPGRRPWQGTVVVKADGSTTSISVPELALEGAATEVEPAKADPAPHEVEPAPEPKPARSSGGLARRWPALAAGGIGVVGVAVGSVFGLRSMSKKDEASKHCDGSVCSDREGPQLKQDAIDAGNLSTVGFVVGGIGLAAGAVLWFALPGSADHAEAQPRVRVGLGRTLTLEGQW